MRSLQECLQYVETNKVWIYLDMSDDLFYLWKRSDTNEVLFRHKSKLHMLDWLLKNTLSFYCPE